MFRYFLVAVALLLLSAARAAAYDSSGRRIEAILSSIEFIDSSNDFDPALVDWSNAEQRELARTNIRAVLTEMPLDLADVRDSKLVLYTGRCIFPYQRDQLSLIPGNTTQEKRDNMFKNCQADNADTGAGSIALSGRLYLFAEDPNPDMRRLFAGVLLHEVVHEWEGPGPNEAPPSKTAPFYELRRNRLAAAWAQVSGTDREHWNASEYRRLRLPTRNEPQMGGCYVFFFSGCRLDMHSMDNYREYLAVLAEILWIYPAGARQYAPEEIAWVRHNLYRDRDITPYVAPQ